ncbi:unnamed protein product [Staurois parvus]|uniref:Amelotin n=1 Tax=Staurois parvus TaxID=386267 RepID=A0ABN9CCT6_9NEOB|nr:unnamed protein product [Staurois parvus]
MGSAATLQLLLNPLLHGAAGNKQGLLGAAPAVSLLANPALSTALLQLVLQAQSPTQKPGILGDSPLATLYGALGLSPQLTPPGKPILPDLGIGSLPAVGIPSDLGTPQLQQFLGPQPPDWDSPPPTPVLSSFLSGLPKTTEPVMSLLGEPPVHPGQFMNFHGRIPSTASLGQASKPATYKQKSAVTRVPLASLQESMLTPTEGYPFDFQTELPPRSFSQNRDRTVSNLSTLEPRNKVFKISRAQ